MNFHYYFLTPNIGHTNNMIDIIFPNSKFFLVVKMTILTRIGRFQFFHYCTIPTSKYFQSDFIYVHVLSLYRTLPHVLSKFFLYFVKVMLCLPNFDNLDYYNIMIASKRRRHFGFQYHEHDQTIFIFSIVKFLLYY